jgi:hypothetical protein
MSPAAAVKSDELVQNDGATWKWRLRGSGWLVVEGSLFFSRFRWGRMVDETALKTYTVAMGKHCPFACGSLKAA